MQALDPARLEPLIGPERMAGFEAVVERAQEALAGRIVWNVNSTGVGGGVAEMLQTLLAYARGGGVDARWLVIQGDPPFFAITKRIHNGLYGSLGDGGDLGDGERLHYERTLRRNAEEIRALVRERDIVLLHDPQTAGLVATLRRAGALVVWRCHVGRDEPNEWTERAWSFLRPYLEEIDASVFSRSSFAPAWADPDRMYVIPPSIDPFSAKNEPMSQRNVQRALAYVGLLDGERLPPVVSFTRRDGSPGRINRHVDVVQSGPAAPADAPLVVQVSRWDPMKDMAGVMMGFAEHVEFSLGAHLLLAGAVRDRRRRRPGGGRRLRRLHRALAGASACGAGPRSSRLCTDGRSRRGRGDRQRAPAPRRSRRAEEPRRGLRSHRGRGDVEVTPVVASAVGGIVDQMDGGTHGLLIDDPHDLAAFGAAVETLLQDRAEAERLRANARARAVAEFLGDRHLNQYAELFERLMRAPQGS